MGATFVLVHGGGHGGWCWRWTAPVLRSRGHEVFTPTLTGFGERTHLDGPSVTFETFVTDVANVLAFEDLQQVVLVGHSMGGVVIPRVAEVVPDRIKRVVWLGAAVTADTECLMEAVPRSRWVGSMVIGPDGTARSDPDLHLTANLHDGTDVHRQFVHERHLPYPRHTLVEPGRLSAFLALGVPAGYVAASDDRVIEPSVAWWFADRLPDCRRAEVPGGHDCMITQPDAVATALEAMAE